MRFAAIILAAGESRRMGRDKALLPWPAVKPAARGTTLLDAILANAQVVSRSVVVVGGRNFDSLANAVAGMPQVELVKNEDPTRGMFSSLQLGASIALAADAAGAIVFHIDRPPVSLAALRSLLQSLECATNGVVAVVPRHRGSHGHPYAVTRKLLREIVAAPVDSNARDLMHAIGRVEYIDCDDPAVLLNLNTPEDYASAAKSAGRSE